MRKLKEIARLCLELNLGVRPIARVCDVSTSTVSLYVDKLKRLGMTYPQICRMEEEVLSRLLFPKEGKTPKKPLPDFHYIHKELKKKGVSLQLLYEEYKQNNPDGYEHTQFYRLYHRWAGKGDPVMRFSHKAGEKMFVDFSGDRPSYRDLQQEGPSRRSSSCRCWGQAPIYSPEPLRARHKENFADCNVRVMEYYGGCPECIVPDNLKGVVPRACYYNPEINLTFAVIAEHYNIAVLPARRGKARDKAKVENAVLQVQRRILTALRNRDNQLHGSLKI